MILVAGENISGSTSIAIFVLSIGLPCLIGNGLSTVLTVLVFCAVAFAMLRQHSPNIVRENEAHAGIDPSGILAAKVNSIPLETYVHADNLSNLSARDLRNRLQSRRIELRAPFEKEELVASLKSHHSSSQNSCPICCDDFSENSGEDSSDSILRVLPSCHHLFHIECIDRWILSRQPNGAAGARAVCPLCNTLL
jgi:hypothetical protein